MLFINFDSIIHYFFAIRNYIIIIEVDKNQKCGEIVKYPTFFKLNFHWWTPFARVRNSAPALRHEKS